MKKQKVLLVALCLVLAALCFWYFAFGSVTVDGRRYFRYARELDLSGKPLEQLERLSQFPNLQRLDLRDTGISNADAAALQEQLASCQILLELSFQGQYWDPETTSVTVTALTAGDLPDLAYFSGLEQVDAQGCRDYDLLLELQAQYPEVTVNYTVAAGGVEYGCGETDVAAADLSAEEAESLLKYLPELKTLTLTGSLPAAEELLALAKQYAGVALSWEVELAGQTVGNDAKTLDLSGVKELTPEALDTALAGLPALERLTLTGCGLKDADLAALEEKYPGVDLVWDTDLGGKTFTTDQTRLDLSGISVTMEQLEQQLSYFDSLEWVDLSDSDFSNEALDALQQRLDGVRVVWTVYIQGVPLRTDATSFMPVLWGVYVDDGDVEVLRYCTDMVYVDLGHMYIYNCEFVSYMPKLKYLILADTSVSDISPLAGLKELVWLELLTSRVSDYTPLLGCTALEDLNLCYTSGDIEPICSMTWLKNLWWGDGTMLTDGEKAELRAALPDTRIETEVGNSTGAGWRQLPNYYAMRDFVGLFYMDD